MPNEDLDIISLWASIRRGLLRLVLVTLIVGALTFGVLSLIAPQYTSETLISFSSKTISAMPDDNKDGASSNADPTRLDPQAINTHVRALSAPQLLLRVGKTLELGERPEFNSARGASDTLSYLLQLIGIGGPRPGETDEDRMLAAIKQKLVVSAARESRSVGIRFSSTDPQLAAAFANTLAESYRRSLVDVPVQETTDIVTALMPKIEQLKSEVLDAEAAAERFRAETDQFRSGAQQTPVNTQRMAALNEELTKAEAAAGVAESKWITARDLNRVGSVEALPDVQNSPVIQGLLAQRVRLERQVFEAQAALLPAHPRMRQLQSDLRGLRRTIAAQVQQVVVTLEKEYRAAALRVASIKRQLDELKQKVVDTSGDEAKLKALESSAKAKRGELERLQKKVEDNKTVAATGAVPVEAQIVSAARVSGVPTFPKKLPYTLLAMAATFVLGLAMMAARAIILAGRPSAAVQYADDVPDPEHRAHDNGVVHAVSGPQPSQVRIAAAVNGGRVETAGLAVAQAARGPHNAAVSKLGGIADHLHSNATPDSGYRSIIAGETDAIDPTSEAVTLAEALAAHGGDVILVDWSLDGKGSSSDLGVNTRPGMMELLARTSEFEEVITRLPSTGVHFLPCGQAPAEAGTVLEPEGLNLVLDALDEVYRHIVVVGRFDAAAALFEAIQGRFDAGITVVDPRRSRRVATGGDDTFLGFEVTDIDVIRYERSERSATASRRVQLSQSEAEAV